MNKISDTIVTIAVSLIGLATLAVIVSKRADTSGVINSLGKAFSDMLKTVISPVA